MLDERVSDDGMAQLQGDGFSSALSAICTDWPDAPVVACGMVGARQGWMEAPYDMAPCAPPGVARAVRPAGTRVAILPGVAQASPADVMRGEETQIAGLLAARPQFDGVVCLPGTHTKWVHVSAGEIVSFQTFMSGEIFALLAGQSVLRHSVAETGWNADAFETALGDALSRPAAVSAHLFSLRAQSLLGPSDGAAARARLSGLLIGLELGATRPYWLGQEVVVIGAPEISDIYQSALALQGVQALQADAGATVRAGLWAARNGS